MRKILAFGIGFVVAMAATSGTSLAGSLNVFTDAALGGSIPCQTDGTTGISRCEGPGNAAAKTVRSFDGTPIDVNFSLPNRQEFGEPPYPTVMFFHGYGGSKEGFGGYLQRFNQLGYAAFSMTERGFGRSCGEPNPLTELANGGEDCSKGFIHLMDSRYEVRDAQYLIGQLVDEGLVEPDRIASVGASYGGGKSMALASLRDRIMLGGLPGEEDGDYAPWESPEGTPISLAAAAPIVPWTDIAYALMPNGRTLEYLVDQPYMGPASAPVSNPFGVMKIGILGLLYTSGDNYSGDGVGTDALDPAFDVPGWKAEMELGESYAAREKAAFVLDQMTTYHSSYYIDDSVKPPPLLIAQGYSDDLFPLTEALRYYNRTKATHPSADISLLFADVGHPRAPLSGPNAQGRPDDQELGFQRIEAWLGHYLLDQGPKPANGVEVKTQICPYEDPSGGPFAGRNWAAMAPGEVRLADNQTRTIGADSNDAESALNFGPISDACRVRDVTPEPGTVTYTFPAVPEGGYTLMGAPTVEADISVANGSESQIAARLFEVDEGGGHRLVARGIYRPDASGRQVFQLGGTAYHFPFGAVPKLVLTAGDAAGLAAASSFRASNDQQDVTLSGVEVRLPVREEPGSGKGQVKVPLPKTVPAGFALSRDYRSANAKVTAVRIASGKASLTLACPASAYSCGESTVDPRILVGGRKVALGRKAGIVLAPGDSRKVSIPLSNSARKAVSGRTVKVVSRVTARAVGSSSYTTRTRAGR